MMYGFIRNNYTELVDRCRAKVAMRPKRQATPEQLSNGIPMFLKQLQRTLEAEADADEKGVAESLKISGNAGGTPSVSEMGVSATAHGKELLVLGFSVDQVVHDYGDLCQSITDLAFERDAPFSIDEFRTLNRCLDNAIANAVSAFSFERDAVAMRQQNFNINERVGILAHELRNSLATASYALAALEQGNLSVSGSTGAVLKRSLNAMNTLIKRSFDEVRSEATGADGDVVFSVLSFIAEAKNQAILYSTASDCKLTVAPVDRDLQISGDYQRLLAALENLLQNAFKFTHPNTEVILVVRSVNQRILIEVHDHCGGLAPGYKDRMFKPFSERTGQDKSGLGLGLSIARASVEADGGTLTVEDVTAVGCVFTISLPRHH